MADGRFWDRRGESDGLVGDGPVADDPGVEVWAAGLEDEALGGGVEGFVVEEGGGGEGPVGFGGFGEFLVLVVVGGGGRGAVFDDEVEGAVAGAVEGVGVVGEVGDVKAGATDLRVEGG